MQRSWPAGYIYRVIHTELCLQTWTVGRVVFTELYLQSSVYGVVRGVFTEV